MTALYSKLNLIFYYTFTNIIVYNFKGMIIYSLFNIKRSDSKKDIIKIIFSDNKFIKLQK